MQLPRPLLAGARWLAGDQEVRFRGDKHTSSAPDAADLLALQQFETPDLQSHNSYRDYFILQCKLATYIHKPYPQDPCMVYLPTFA